MDSRPSDETLLLAVVEHDTGSVNATLAPVRAESAAGRTTFVTLAAREMHRFVLNPVFVFAVVMTAWMTWDDRKAPATGVGTGNWYAWIFLGGFGMTATFWLTRSMRDSEPVAGVTPTALPARTGALCAVAVVPFLCGVLTLFAFLHFHPVGARVYGAFSPSAQVAVLVGQIVIPSLGGPLLGVALGRWVHFPGAALVLFLVIFGWVNVATFGSLSHPDSAAFRRGHHGQRRNFRRGVNLFPVRDATEGHGQPPVRNRIGWMMLAAGGAGVSRGRVGVRGNRARDVPRVAPGERMFSYKPRNAAATGA